MIACATSRAESSLSARATNRSASSRLPQGIAPDWDTNPGFERARGVSQAGLDRLDYVLADMGGAMGEDAAGRWGRRYLGEMMSTPAFRRFGRRPAAGEAMPVAVLPSPPEGTRSRLLALPGFAARKPPRKLSEVS